VGPGVKIPMRRSNFEGRRGRPIVKYKDTLRSPVRFAVKVVGFGGPKKAQVQSYLPGGANMPTWEGTLAPPGEYD